VKIVKNQYICQFFLSKYVKSHMIKILAGFLSKKQVCHKNHKFTLLPGLCEQNSVTPSTSYLKKSELP